MYCSLCGAHEMEWGQGPIDYRKAAVEALLQAAIDKKAAKDGSSKIVGPTDLRAIALEFIDGMAWHWTSYDGGTHYLTIGIG